MEVPRFRACQRPCLRCASDGGAAAIHVTIWLCFALCTSMRGGKKVKPIFSSVKLVVAVCSGSWPALCQAQTCISSSTSAARGGHGGRPPPGPVEGGIVNWFKRLEGSILSSVAHPQHITLRPRRRAWAGPEALCCVSTYAGGEEEEGAEGEDEEDEEGGGQCMRTGPRLPACHSAAFRRQFEVRRWGGALRDRVGVGKRLQWPVQAKMLGCCVWGQRHGVLVRSKDLGLEQGCLQCGRDSVLKPCDGRYSTALTTSCIMPGTVVTLQYFWMLVGGQGL